MWIEPLKPRIYLGHFFVKGFNANCEMVRDGVIVSKSSNLYLGTMTTRTTTLKTMTQTVTKTTKKMSTKTTTKKITRSTFFLGGGGALWTV